MIDAIEKNIRIRYTDENEDDQKCSVSTSICRFPLILLDITFRENIRPMKFILCRSRNSSWLIDTEDETLIRLRNTYRYEYLANDLEDFGLEASETECLTHALQIVMDDKWFIGYDQPENILRAQSNEVEGEMPF